MEKDIKFVNTQFAVFFEEKVRPDALISDFVNVMGDIFDQAPLTIPTKDDQLNEFMPIVQFNSTNGLHASDFSRKRADYYHFSSDRTTQFSYEDKRADIMKNIEIFFKFFSEKAKITRVAFIVQYFIETKDEGESLTNLLSDSFIKIFDGTPRSANIEYISRVKTKDEKFDLNNRTVISKSEVTFFENKNEVRKKGVLILRDINTVPGINSLDFNIENLKIIINESEKLFKIKDIASRHEQTEKTIDIK